jgi:hypothetical protein
LKRAIAKYGIENFSKTVLHVFDTEAKMNLAEKILVVIDPEVSYNICPGGHGGFGYINRTLSGKDKHIDKATKAWLHLHNTDAEWRKWKGQRISQSLLAVSDKLSKIHKAKFTNRSGYFYGLKHSPESIRKMSEANKGKRCGAENSQAGTCWITNGVDNKKIKIVDALEWSLKGYYRGRAT